MKNIMDHFPKIHLRKCILSIVFICVVILLICHTFNLGNITIDTTTIALLLLVLIIPFFDLIRKIKYGDFEAEIDPREVDRTITKVNIEYSPTAAPEESTDNEILLLVQSDPQLGLAKLRIEIEKTLSLLLSQRKEPIHTIRSQSIIKTLTELQKNGTIPVELASALRHILPLINRAVHGHYIRQEDANKVALIGVPLLNNLKEIYQEQTFQPLERTVIPFDDVEKYEQSKYRVTTAIPYVENPVKNVYIWDHDTLMNFIFNSSEHAEFPISIERIEE